jgi:zinc/manganese transport system substrate-binding protein
VTSIVASPNADPHDYEPTPNDARDVAMARYVVVNGLGYDSWARRLVDANPDSHRIVLDIGALLHLPSDANPHQWYSPTAVAAVVDRVSADLSKLDPAHRAEYQANHDRFLTQSLAPYDRVLHDIEQHDRGVAIGASESVITPLATALRLRVATPDRFLRAISEGADPTASDKDTIAEQIAHHQIRAFVFNTQNATPDVQRIVDSARAVGIPVVPFTETLSPAKATFQDWQVAQLRALAMALQS